MRRKLRPETLYDVDVFATIAECARDTISEAGTQTRMDMCGYPVNIPGDLFTTIAMYAERAIEAREAGELRRCKECLRRAHRELSKLEIGEADRKTRKTIGRVLDSIEGAC